MNRVYLLNENRITGGGFNSLLMNDLNERNIRFSNIITTRMIDYNNILLYIVNDNFYLKTVKDQIADIDAVYDILQHFEYKIVITKNPDNYHIIRPLLNGYVTKRGFKYYQTIGYDTTISRIITNSCLRILSNSNKFHSK